MDFILTATQCSASNSIGRQATAFMAPSILFKGNFARPWLGCKSQA